MSFLRLPFPSLSHSSSILSVFIIILNLSKTTECISDTAYSRLRDSLLVGYDPNLRPMQNTNYTTNLWMSFRPRSFDLDEATSVFTLSGVMQLVWRDNALRWDPVLFENITFVRFETEQLWRPSITVFNNAATRSFEDIHSMGITANYRGLVIWFPIVKFQARCDHDLKKFPFDANQCNVRIGSWMHNGEEVNMVFTPSNVTQVNVNLNLLMYNADWLTTSATATIKNRVFECCPSYQEYNIEWRLKRRSAFHFAIIFVPAIAIALMILTTFWINPSSIERLSLLIVVTLINTIFLSYSHERIPKNGDNVPLAILYYRDSLVMIILAFVWTIFSRSLTRSKRSSDIPLPGFILHFLDSWPSKILCLESRPQNTDNMVSTIDQDWVWLALLLDRLVFFIYLIVYIVFVFAFL